MLDIAKIPFSYFGSYFVVSYYLEEGLFIRDIRNGDMDAGNIFHLVPCCTSGKPIPYDCVMQEHLLEVFDLQNGLLLKFCFADEDTLLISTEQNVLLRLELWLQKYDHINPLTKKIYELHSYSQEVKMLLHIRRGQMTTELAWERIGHNSATLLLGDAAELTIESYLVVAKRKEHGNFAACAAKAKQHYEDFQSKLPVVHLQDTGNKACYILFSCTVQPEGILKKYAVYMSNNYMTNIWSWDHAFTSLSMCYKLPEMAYEQFMYFKEFQDESGIFPDFINNKYSSFSCCKPPIHGFIYQILMRENSYFLDINRLTEVYQMLGHLASYWEKYRKHGNLYFYNHGNDSGWDNASIFSQGCPVLSPDLMAYLITLYDALADIAAQLPINRGDEAMHRSKAKELAKYLVAELWNGQYFVARKFNGELVEAKYCLLRLLPLVAAQYLATDIVTAMLKELSDPRQFTNFGFATERIDSPFYESHGYWRGPIWAPSTLFLVESLAQCGEFILARSAAERFCRLCEMGGLAENFDAESGEGLEDPAFAWTSSVFLYLGEKLQQDSQFIAIKGEV